MEYCLPVAGQRAVTFRVLPKKPSINSPYVLGPGDCLQIKLCGGPQSERHPTGADAIGPSEVCEAATVDAPMIGSVPASDLTTDDLKRETATKLADGYVKAPKSRRQNFVMSAPLRRRRSQPSCLPIPAPRDPGPFPPLATAGDTSKRDSSRAGAGLRQAAWT
jgi:hypothetical protein